MLADLKMPTSDEVLLGLPQTRPHSGTANKRHEAGVLGRWPVEFSVDGMGHLRFGRRGAFRNRREGFALMSQTTRRVLLRGAI
jgi:hypothetical protein